MKLALLVFGLLNLFASCVPNTPTAPPDAHMPQGYRGVAADTGSLGSVPWRKLYDDPVLQGLIESSLHKNYNAQLAYTSVLQAVENLAIVHANQGPFVNAQVQLPYQVTTQQRPADVPGSAFAPSLGFTASYQIDLFGKLASATSAARAQLLSTDAGRNVVLATLVSQCANAYFQLLELDQALDISLRAVKAREENVRLMRMRVDYGESSLQDLRQSQQSLYEVTENIPTIRQNIAQTENALSVLAGDYPHAITRGLALEQQVHMPLLPPTGVASELLQRRPDIAQAEYTLVQGDANLDVARKLLYPSLQLGASASVAGQVATGVYPSLPSRVSSLAGINGTFYGPQGVFTILPQLLQPIFNSGQLKANVRLARDQQEAAALSYLQTVQSAFEEVSNDITAYNQQRLREIQLGLYTAASLDSTRLALLRYENGETSYLEVLNAETRSYQAEIDFVEGRLNSRLALVQLYLALGGGWQQA